MNYPKTSQLGYEIIASDILNAQNLYNMKVSPSCHFKEVFVYNGKGKSYERIVSTCARIPGASSVYLPSGPGAGTFLLGYAAAKAETASKQSEYFIVDPGRFLGERG